MLAAASLETRQGLVQAGIARLAEASAVLRGSLRERLSMRIGGDGTHALEARGAAAIHVSSGGLSNEQRIALGPGYQMPFAEWIKAETGLTTIAVGLITELRQAEEILTAGQADAIALARAMLYAPRWPWHAAAELGAQVRAPRRYWRSQPRELKDLFKDTQFGQR